MHRWRFPRSHVAISTTLTKIMDEEMGSMEWFKLGRPFTGYSTEKQEKSLWGDRRRGSWKRWVVSRNRKAKPDLVLRRESRRKFQIMRALNEKDLWPRTILMLNTPIKFEFDDLRVLVGLQGCRSSRYDGCLSWRVLWVMVAILNWILEPDGEPVNFYKDRRNMMKRLTNGMTNWLTNKKLLNL